jgi:TonB family protein
MKIIALILGLTSAALAQQPYRGNFQQPRIISKPEPDYPRQAWQHGIGGTVTLNAIIDAEGLATRITIDKGIDGLNETAIAAVQRWRWLPATCAGKAIPLQAKIDLQFRLGDQNANPQPPPVDSQIAPVAPPEPPPAAPPTQAPPTQPVPLETQSPRPSSQQLPELREQAKCETDAYQTPRIKTKTEPKYTPQAQQAGIQGTVTLTMIVNEAGEPKYIELYRGLDPGLNQRAIEAARNWRFYPATCAGKPVAAFSVVDTTFRLIGPPEDALPDNPEPVDRSQSDGTPTLKQEEPLHPAPQPRLEPRLSPRLSLGQGEIAANVFRRCSEWVTVTNSAANSEYTSRWAWSSSGSQANWSIVIYNGAADSVASFQEHSPEKVAEKICRYFHWKR